MLEKQKKNLVKQLKFIDGEQANVQIAQME
jgi:hypothetical protein